MDNDSYILDASLQRLLDVKDVTRGDLVEIREMLKGGSIVDWLRAHFRSIPGVNDFLKVYGFDPDNMVEMGRLQELHRGAVNYIIETLGIKLPPVLTHPAQVQKLFLYASSSGPYRMKACTLLKVMHVLNHLDARQLVYNLTISERELFSRLEKRVSATVMQMVDAGFDIDEYVPSQKTKESLVTKMLSKPQGTAARVFDRIRFRIIANQRKQLIPILFYLKKHLLPFPCIIPGESNNTLLPFADLVKESFGLEIDLDGDGGKRHRFNPFSHKDFRVVSFVVDVPLRVTDLVQAAGMGHLSRFGHVVFIPTEFQLFDKASHFLNESGPAAHSQYKERQVREVITRLYRGHPEKG